MGVCRVRSVSSLHVHENDEITIVPRGEDFIDFFHLSCTGSSRILGCCFGRVYELKIMATGVYL